MLLKDQEDQSAAAKDPEDRSATAKDREDQSDDAKGSRRLKCCYKGSRISKCCYKGSKDRSVVTKDQVIECCIRSRLDVVEDDVLVLKILKIFQ